MTPIFVSESGSFMSTYHLWLVLGVSGFHSVWVNASMFAEISASILENLFRTVSKTVVPVRITTRQEMILFAFIL